MHPRNLVIRGKAGSVGRDTLVGRSSAAVDLGEAEALRES